MAVIDVGEKSENIDPLAKARLRGFFAQRAMLEAEGGALVVSEMAERLEISEREVDNLRKAGQLLAVYIGGSEVYGDSYVYPAWQVGLLDFDRIIRLASENDTFGSAFGLIDFMLNRNARLDDRRPIDALQRGDVAAVENAVRMYGEQGA